MSNTQPSIGRWLAVLVLVSAPAATTAAAGAAEPRDALAVQPGDHVRGNPEARFTLIEYSDYECPFCRRFHDTAKRFVAQSRGDANWVFRHLPLGFHNPAAMREARGAECVAVLGGNEAFWRFSDRVFEATGGNGRGLPDGMRPLAKAVGVARPEFAACVKSGRTDAAVRADRRDAKALGVRVTPQSYLVDNVTGEVVTLTGARPLKMLQDTMALMRTEP